MMGEPVRWSDEAQAVISGDITTAVAYLTPAGGAVVAAPGLLPPGSRRAGLLAHAYRAQLVGLSARTFTGWLEVTGDGAALYAPHTSKGFVAPPRENLLLVSNGLLAKFGIWQAHRRGTVTRLEQLAVEKASSAPGQRSLSVPRRP